MRALGLQAVTAARVSDDPDALQRAGAELLQHGVAPRLDRRQAFQQALQVARIVIRPWLHQRLFVGVVDRKAFAGAARRYRPLSREVIRRLEHVGLVAKTADPTDGRLNVLNLTRKAGAVAPEILSLGAALEKSIEQAVGKEDLEAMIRGLEAIRELEL